MRRRVLVGLAVVSAYLIAVSATVALRADHERPLYDGFVPPTSYRFVDPPAFFAAENVKPNATSTMIALGPDGSEPAGVATPDGQFVINLGRDDIATARGAAAVSVQITPLAPRQLPPVPSGLRPNGNAYRVEMTYQPHGGPVTHLAKPGTLLMEIPEIGQQLFVSSDAKTWSLIASRVISPSALTMTAEFDAPGDYVAATNLPELAAPGGHASHVAIVVGIAVTTLALAMFLGAYAVVRRRRVALGRLE